MWDGIRGELQMVRMGIVLPLLGQPRLRLQQDLQHGPTVLRGEARKVLALVLTGEYLQQAAIHVVLRRRGYCIERVRVDEVAARIAEDALHEVEVPQRSALRIAQTPSREFLRKRRCRQRLLR